MDSETNERVKWNRRGKKTEREITLVGVSLERSCVTIVMSEEVSHSEMSANVIIDVKFFFVNGTSLRF